MPENDPLGYLRPNDLMGMERLGLQREKMGMQGDQYAATNAFRQQDARRKAIESMMKMRGGGSGLQEALYRDITGGHIPGATRHNELLDQDTFWRGIREQSTQRQQPQGLYRSGDEYGFNGERMGNLSQMAPAGTNPGDYFDQIQAKHFANQERMAGQDLDSNMGDMTAQYRQAAAMQQAEMRRKQAGEFMKTFEGQFGVKPGVAFENYDASTGTSNIPGSVKVDSFGNRIDIPGRQMRIPIAFRKAYGGHAAALAGLEDEEQMQMEDPSFAEMRQLQKEREESEREERQRNIRSTVAQRSTSSLHQIRLQTDPAYRAQFMGGLGAESQQMNQALQRSPGGPQQRPDWMQGAGFMPPTSFSFGY